MMLCNLSRVATEAVISEIVRGGVSLWTNGHHAKMRRATDCVSARKGFSQ